MEIATLQVERRTQKGRNQLAALRAQGKVPAVLYGGEGKENIDLVVDEHEFEGHIRHHHKVFRLQMDGKEQAIFMQDVQWDCLTDRAIHLDFLRIDLTAKMHVEVELAFVGHPKGAARGGRLIKDVVDLKVFCLPASIPESIEVKVGDLDLGDAITVANLELPEGVEADLPPHAVICHLPGEEAVLAEAAAAAAAAEEAAGGVQPERIGESDKAAGDSAGDS